MPHVLPYTIKLYYSPIIWEETTRVFDEPILLLCKFHVFFRLEVYNSVVATFT